MKGVKTQVTLIRLKLLGPATATAVHSLLMDNGLQAQGRVSLGRKLHQKVETERADYKPPGKGKYKKPSSLLQNLTV